MEGKLYEYFDERLFSHLPPDELRSGLSRWFQNTDQEDVSVLSRHSQFFTVFFFITCHLCQFLIFPSFPDVTLFIAKGPNVIPSSLIIVMLGLAAKWITKEKNTVSSNGKRRQRSDKSVHLFWTISVKTMLFWMTVFDRWAIYCCNI